MEVAPRYKLLLLFDIWIVYIASMDPTLTLFILSNSFTLLFKKVALLLTYMYC